MQSGRKQGGYRRQLQKGTIRVVQETPPIPHRTQFLQEGTIKHGNSIPTTEIEVEERQKKRSIIIIAHTIIEPYTMVIKLQNTLQESIR